MSQSEVERFVADLKSDESMRSELTGSASGVGSVVSFAKDKGYDITADEARDYIQGQSNRELSDDELDAVAGGKGHTTSSVTQVSAVQTVSTVSTEAVTAETTTTAAAEVEVVAVAVIVLT